MTTTGGVPPVRWFISADTTAEFTADMMYFPATLDETTGALVAGPKAGYIGIEAIDSEGAETLAEVKVGAPTASPPWADAGADLCVVDAGAAGDAGHDAAAHHDAQAAEDAGDASTDAAPDSGGTPEVSDGGCRCETASGRASTPPFAALGIVFGFGVWSRRRRRAARS